MALMFRHFLAASLLVPAAAACAHTAPPSVTLSAYDAVAVAPVSHEILLENDEVRVLRVSIAPGAAEPVHEHQWPSIMYFEQPQPITYVTYALQDGQLVRVEFKKGDPSASSPKGTQPAP